MEGPGLGKTFRMNHTQLFFYKSKTTLELEISYGLI